MTPKREYFSVHINKIGITDRFLPKWRTSLYKEPKPLVREASEAFSYPSFPPPFTFSIFVNKSGICKKWKIMPSFSHRHRNLPSASLHPSGSSIPSAGVKCSPMPFGIQGPRCRPSAPIRPTICSSPCPFPTTLSKALTEKRTDGPCSP